MRRQTGFAMLELVVALLIATLLAIFAASRLAERGREVAAENHAVWMVGVRTGVQRYIEQHAQALLERGAAAPIPGFSNPLAPTISELRAAGHLTQGYPARGGGGVGADVLLIRGPLCPEDGCQLEAIIYSDRPLGQSGRFDYRPDMVAHWLSQSAGHGGAVLAGRPHHISGAGFTYDNPPVGVAAALPLGTVALAITAEQLDALAYLRVRDPRDPQFQGSASVAGDLTAQSALHVHDYLRIDSQASALTACSSEGAVVQEGLGGLLICRTGQWRSAGGRGGGGYSTNSLQGCTAAGANPVTGTCSCAHGYMPVRIADSTSAIPAEGRTRGYICVATS